MSSSQRIIVNTIAQYCRTALNVVLSLVATRLILSALGQTDYGIYMVVAGTIAMLGFMTNALVTTTQRYLAYYEGEKDFSSAYTCFGNSVLLHVLIGLGILLILLGLEPVIMRHFLQIPTDRLIAAQWVYVAASIMMSVSIIVSPFRALFIAKENIVFISIIDILDYVLKVAIAVILLYVAQCDKLILYGGLMSSIAFVNLIILGAYAHIHYAECHWVSWREWNGKYMRELTSFATWTLYSAGCFMVRAQGIGIVLNRFFGTIINAAYGIALQVSTATSMLAQAILNAISPQVYKAEGEHNREQVFRLSNSACKFSLLLVSIVTIPMLFEITPLLECWLGTNNVPEKTVLFVQFTLIALIGDQLTNGLGLAIQATGQVKYNALIINTIKVLTLPIAWLCLHCGLNVDSVMWCYLIIEMLCAWMRLPYLRRTVFFEQKTYWRTMIHCVPTIIICIAMSWLCTHFMHFPFRFLVTISATIIAGALMVFVSALSNTERTFIYNVIHKHHLSC